MRMTFVAEFRWAVAVVLLSWVLKMTEREASPDMLRAFAELAQKFKNDKKFDVVAKRSHTF